MYFKKELNEIEEEISQKEIKNIIKIRRENSNIFFSKKGNLNLIIVVEYNKINKVKGFISDELNENSISFFRRNFLLQIKINFV